MQRLACVITTGAIRTAPTEALLLPTLYLAVEGEARRAPEAHPTSPLTGRHSRLNGSGLVPGRPFSRIPDQSGVLQARPAQPSGTLPSATRVSTHGTNTWELVRGDALAKGPSQNVSSNGSAYDTPNRGPMAVPLSGTLGTRLVDRSTCSRKKGSRSGECD